MILYSTPDGAQWLYGGARPVGLGPELLAALELYLPHIGEVSWPAHSQLWAGTLAEVTLDGAARAIVRVLLETYPDGPTAEEVARIVRTLLTHPG